MGRHRSKRRRQIEKAANDDCIMALAVKMVDDEVARRASIYKRKPEVTGSE